MTFCLLFILQEAPRGFDNVVQTLYLTTKFEWSSGQLLGFKAVTALCSAVGQFLLFPVMIKILGMNINMIGMTTVISRVGHYLLLAVAPAHSDWLLYVSALVNCLQGVQSIIIRSSISKELSSQELGTVFAINEICVTLLPLVTSPLATAIYNATTSSFQVCIPHERRHGFC